MPVEIKELIIRAVTTAEPDACGDSNSSGNAAPDQEAIIRACVRQVLHILRRKQER